MTPMKLAPLLLLPYLYLGVAVAAPMQIADVPDPLKPWVTWVLHGEQERFCPPQHDKAAQRLCHWPSRLKLNLDGKGGEFELSARSLSSGWMTLPGDGPKWPQDVHINGQMAAVSNRGGVPSVRVGKGDQRIGGRFSWNALPESLRLPPDSGLLALTLSGKSVPHPQRDARNQLWLGTRDTAIKSEADHLELRVYRLIDDDIPFRVITQIEVNAGGEVREEVIGPVLLSGLTALSLNGPLPARIEADGRLRLQVRPGNWTITLVARSNTPLNSLSAGLADGPWPSQEIWSVRAHHDLRVIEISGAPATDPRQTGVPEQWHGLPAFLIEAGTILKFEQRQRGSANIAPDELHLSRQLWLDFDGAGYTVQDHLSGRIARTWRLDANAPIELGRAEIDGQAQLITRHEDGTGVEVRHGALQLSADSRIAGPVRSLPVGGWNIDLQSVETTLHLPPAWRLLAAPGVDNVPDTWLSRWTLLNLFLVLVASIAAMRLFGVGTGALTLLTLALIWHEPGAPTWSWLNLIAAIALLRALPKSFDDSGRFRKLLGAYQWISVGLLVFIALPFSINQARLSLYPQLENGHGFTADADSDRRSHAAEIDQLALDRMRSEESIMAGPAAPPHRTLQSAMKKVQVLAEEDRAGKSQVAQSSIQKLDPNVLTQTGPGLPHWNWRQASLHWSGPVTDNQTYRLWLMPPILTRAQGWLSIILIATLIASWLKPSLRLPSMRKSAAASSSLLALLLLSVLMGLPGTGQAAVAKPVAPVAEPPSPHPDLLDELRQRLTAQPDCMPDCADWSRLHVDINADDVLLLRITAEAQTDTALPLPVPQLSRAQSRVWQPEQVLVDSREGDLRRDRSGVLWLRLPEGRHEVIIRGSLSGFTELQLPLSPPPQQLSYLTPGWLVSGVNKNGKAGNVINLTREQPVEVARAGDGAEQTVASQTLPPLLTVRRTLQLGLVWQAQNSLSREGDTTGAYIAKVPPLPGEVVSGDGVRVVSGEIQAAFSPGQRHVSWSSRLDTSNTITLKAADQADLIEVWNFDISPLWHVEFSGIPAISNQQNQWRLSTFRPWPGEEVNVQIARPQAVQGQLLTIDLAELSMRPGKRASDYTLKISVRASQGGQHALPLPEDLQIQSLNIDGRDQPARREGNHLILPLHPGQQNVTLNLRSDSGLQLISRTPALELGLSGTNAKLSAQLPRDRWVLLAGGPALGPAILFWGLFAVLIVVSIGLGRTGMTPLKSFHWALLMVGLSQLPIYAAALVAGWLFALSLRGRMAEGISEKQFNLVQIVLAIWSVAALVILCAAVAQGLLGTPDMQIAGNGSSQFDLRWYQDRFDGALPATWVLSLSIWFYRGLMLLWALWLANSLLNWLRWGWAQYSNAGLWKKKTTIVRPDSGTPSKTAATDKEKPSL